MDPMPDRRAPVAPAAPAAAAFLPPPPATAPDILADVLARGTIGAEDVARLRRHVFADGVVSQAEAEGVFALNEATHGNDPAWAAFFVQSLTDYVVWQSLPRGHVDPALAHFLMQRVAKDGRIDGATELELVVNVVHWAASCPQALRQLALDAVKTSVVAGGGPLFGPGRRRAGVVDRADVEILSKLLYAAGGEASLAVSRAEADLLFDLNDATRGAANDPGWQPLFVAAVAAHLTQPLAAPQLADADAARRRDRWLAERRGVPALLGEMLGCLGRGAVAEAFREADVFGRRRAEAEAAAERAAERAALQRRQIDRAEAEWLRRRLPPGRALDANERALIAFLRRHAAGIDASLAPLFAAA